MSDPQSLNMEEINRYATLMRSKKELNRQIKEIDVELAKMEEPLLEAMASSGLQSLKLTGGGTLFVRTQVWPKFLEGKDRRHVLVALKKDGLGEYIKEDFNANQFAAFVREVHASDDQQLPPHLAECVEASERFKLVLLG